MNSRHLGELALKMSGLTVMWARPIAERLLPETPPLQTTITFSELQALGFCLVGVFALLNGLQALGVGAYTFVAKPAFDETGSWEYLWQRQREGMVRGAIQLAAGSFLVFGRTGIAAGWERLKSSRVPPMDD